jgi:hypothetical protein
MKRRTKIVLSFAVAAFAAMTWIVLAGGLWYYSVDGFGGQRNVLLAPGLESDVALLGESTNVMVPFVFVYTTEKKPYGLRIQIWDESQQYRKIRIAEAHLSYRDGEVIRKAVDWSRDLQPYTACNSSSQGIVYTPMFMLSDQIQGLVERHEDVQVTILGRLIRSDGEEVPFKVTEYFRASSRSGFSTFQEFAAGC